MKSKFIILVFVGFFLTISCEEFLDEKIHSQITSDLLFTSGANAELAVKGIYATYFDDWNTYRALVFAHGGTAEQELTLETANTVCDLKWNSGDGSLAFIWTGLFKGINTANTAIAGMEKMAITDEFTEAKRNQLIAEARFMRAHGYFHLLRYWGGVPINDKPTGNPENAIKPKDTPQAVFEFIVADLKAAQQYLPTTYTNTFPDNGRATRGAATATLAMVYAQVSGVQFQGLIDKKYWAEAKAELVKLIDVTNVTKSVAPYTYSMEPDYKDLFYGGRSVGANFEPVRMANSLGREVIWCINYNPIAFALHGTWYGNNWDTGISKHILTKFSKGDYRTAITLDSISKKPQGLIVNAKIRRNRIGNDNWNNVYFARYAGMLLLLAEVDNEVNNGPTQLALNCINAVRNRARKGLSGLETRPIPADIPAGLTYAQFKDKVFDERVVEMYMEFQYWTDIQRSGRLQTDWAVLGSGDKGNRGTYEARWKFWPIPLNEVVSSGGVIEQNTGH